MAQLQLTNELIDGVLRLLRDNDADAQNPGVASQYLAALLGFTVANLDAPANERQDLMDELTAFAGHVMQDVERQRAQQPPPQEAFGIWKPGDP